MAQARGPGREGVKPKLGKHQRKRVLVVMNPTEADEDAGTLEQSQSIGMTLSLDHERERRVKALPVPPLPPMPSTSNNSPPPQSQSIGPTPSFGRKKVRRIRPLPPLHPVASTSNTSPHPPPPLRQNRIDPPSPSAEQEQPTLDASEANVFAVRFSQNLIVKVDEDKLEQKAVCFGLLQYFRKGIDKDKGVLFVRLDFIGFAGGRWIMDGSDTSSPLRFEVPCECKTPRFPKFRESVRLGDVLVDEQTYREAIRAMRADRNTPTVIVDAAREADAWRKWLEMFEGRTLEGFLKRDKPRRERHEGKKKAKEV